MSAARVALSIAHERGYGKRGERLFECTEDRMYDKFGLVVCEFCARRQRGGSLVPVSSLSLQGRTRPSRLSLISLVLSFIQWEYSPNKQRVLVQIRYKLLLLLLSESGGKALFRPLFQYHFPGGPPQSFAALAPSVLTCTKECRCPAGKV
jgi:hypothetical protein